jgi:hypothetical protein
VDELEPVVQRAAEHLPHQHGVARVVLDEEHPRGQGLPGRGDRCLGRDAHGGGSFTIDSQKASIDRTTDMNSVRSIGLVM